MAGSVYYFTKIQFFGWGTFISDNLKLFALDQLLNFDIVALGDVISNEFGNVYFLGN